MTGSSRVRRAPLSRILDLDTGVHLYGHGESLGGSQCAAPAAHARIRVRSTTMIIDIHAHLWADPAAQRARAAVAGVGTTVLLST